MRRHRSLEGANSHQLASLESTAIYFGGGQHGCPGRGFASVEVTMIVAALLLRYDFRMKDGEERPREFTYQGLSMGNRAKEILIRDRVDIWKASHEDFTK
jgi:cytochrome P450